MSVVLPSLFSFTVTKHILNFLILFSCFIKEKKKRLKNKIFKMKETLQKKLRGKDQLEHLTKALY